MMQTDAFKNQTTNSNVSMTAHGKPIKHSVEIRRGVSIQISTHSEEEESERMARSGSQPETLHEEKRKEKTTERIMKMAQSKKR
jgi:hypothetical protein